MSRPIFLAEAEAEFLEAARFYELQATGLGFEFIAEVHRCTSILEEFPEIGGIVADDLRKYVLRRFPYNLIYAVEGRQVVIVALAHHRRRPFYWGNRRASESRMGAPNGE